LVAASASLTTVATYGRAGSSSRVRIYDWLTHLHWTATTHDYLGTPNLSAQTLLANWRRVPTAEARIRSVGRMRKIENLLMSREATPFSRGGVEKRLLSIATHSSYDFDDAIWADDRGGIHHLFSKPKVWARSVAAADCVIAGNDFLADAAGQFNRNVITIPSCVEPDEYYCPSSYELDESPLLVWLGSPATERHLSLIADALLQLNDHRGVRLKVISSGERSLGPLDRITDRVAWSIDDFAKHLATSAIGVAPLIEDQYSVGKCAYKLIQYGAAGLPIVASPVGANRAVLDALGGLAATSRADWVDAITAVIDDSARARAAMGNGARAAVCEGFSFAAWSAQWRRAVLGHSS
jgi:glycosyltransferase involved in cell wall biosynthesis